MVTYGIKHQELSDNGQRECVWLHYEDKVLQGWHWHEAMNISSSSTKEITDKRNLFWILMNWDTVHGLSWLLLLHSGCLLGFCYKETCKKRFRMMPQSCSCCDKVSILQNTSLQVKSGIFILFHQTWHPGASKVNKLHHTNKKFANHDEITMSSTASCLSLSTLSTLLLLSASWKSWQTRKNDGSQAKKHYAILISRLAWSHQAKAVPGQGLQDATYFWAFMPGQFP